MKKNKKTFKEVFGKNPWDPWSAKAGIAEASASLDAYLKSRGINPKYVSKDTKIAHSKSNQFKQWASTQAQREEVEIKEGMGHTVSRDKDIVSSRKSEISQAQASHKEVKTPRGPGSKHTHKEEVKKPTGDLKKACWKGYTAVGTKMKDGRQVPNCVPEEVELEEGHVHGLKGHEEIDRITNPSTGNVTHTLNKEVGSSGKYNIFQHKVSMRYSGGVHKQLHSGSKEDMESKFAEMKKTKKEEIELEEGSVQDKLHATQQSLRKKSGLPHPDYYMHMKKSYDIADDKERLAKQSEIKKKYGVGEAIDYSVKTTDMLRGRVKGGKNDDLGPGADFKSTKVKYSHESVLHDEPEGTITKVAEKKMSRRSELIKSLYKKGKMVKEDLYDHEKEDKNPAKVHGKPPKLEKADEKENKGENKPQAAATLSGGTTLTKQPRDVVELDPMMRNRPGQPDITKKDDKKKDGDKKEKKQDK